MLQLFWHTFTFAKLATIEMIIASSQSMWFDLTDLIEYSQWSITLHFVYYIRIS